jgi:superfamily II DNA or RNA helicase
MVERKRLSFDAIPGTVGEINHDNGMEIIVRGDEVALSTVKRYLTAHNNGAAYQLALAEKRRVFDDEGANKKREDIANLKEKLVQEYWGERHDGSLSIPIGFWYICDQIQGHLNTTIPYLDVMPSWLRDYQKEDIAKAMKYNRAVICAATGLGKTAICICITHLAQKANKRTCIIVPTIDLVKQTVDSCRSFGIEGVSGAGGNYQFKPGCSVLVTTVQSAYKYIDVFDVVLVDETHHCAATTWFSLLASALNATHVYGLSATPYRTDGMDIGIHAWTGPVISNRDAAWGIANGWLTRPDIYTVQVSGLPYVSSKKLSAVAYKTLATQKKVQEFLLKKIKSGLEAGRTIMVIFNTVKAGEAFKKYCKSVKSDVIFDVAHADYRKPFLDFKEGKTKLLVGNVKLFGEGVDVPKVDCIITLCNNSSEIITRQVIGRAMRIAKGKKDAVILDVWFDNYEPYVRARNNRVQAYLTIVDKIKEICI